MAEASKNLREDQAAQKTGQVPMTFDTVPENMLGPVSDDWQAAEVWLQSVRNKWEGKNPDKRSDEDSTTVLTYRFHLAKLRWYCEHVGRIAPSKWRADDVARFAAFLEKLPQHAYCARKVINGMEADRCYVKEDEPGWTPFRKQPSKSSQADIKRFIHAMFRAWHETGYIRSNPSALSPSSGKRKVHTDRSISFDVYSLALQTIASEQTEKIERRQMQARDLFIFEALCRLGLRASELVEAQMSAFEDLTHPVTKECYRVFYVTGKSGLGGKSRRVPVPPAVWKCFVDYRAAFGLPPTPAPGDTTPLLLSVRKAGTAPATGKHENCATWGTVGSRKGLYKIVKQRLQQAAALLRSDDKFDLATQLEGASPHWLRHTFGKSLVQQGVDIRLLAGALGYVSAETARAYAE